MNITEATERIVQDYANLSGRESANRAEFRKRVKKHLEKLLKDFYEDVKPEKNTVIDGSNLMDRGWNNYADQLDKNKKEWGITSSTSKLPNDFGKVNPVEF